MIGSSFCIAGLVIAWPFPMGFARLLTDPGADEDDGKNPASIDCECECVRARWDGVHDCEALNNDGVDNDVRVDEDGDGEGGEMKERRLDENDVDRLCNGRREPIPVTEAN